MTPDEIAAQREWLCSLRAKKRAKILRAAERETTRVKAAERKTQRMKAAVAPPTLADYYKTPRGRWCLVSPCRLCGRFAHFEPWNGGLKFGMVDYTVHRRTIEAWRESQGCSSCRFSAAKEAATIRRIESLIQTLRYRSTYDHKIPTSHHPV